MLWRDHTIILRVRFPVRVGGRKAMKTVKDYLASHPSAPYGFDIHSLGAMTEYELMETNSVNPNKE